MHDSPRRFPVRAATQLFVSSAAVALGAATFVVANAADIAPAPTLCSAATATITGTAGNDTLTGTRGNDVIWGGGGVDSLSGLQGDDRLCGVEGNDSLFGGPGNDYLDGGGGSDLLRGDSGGADACLNGEQRSSCELVGITTPPATTTTTTTAATPATGRFATLPVGATLPSEQQCATAVRRMTENRPENVTPNAVRGTSPHNEYPRVTGNFVGTTDEILQWAACKWGIDEDLVRAQIAVHSWWSMTAVGDNGESFGLGQVRLPYHPGAFEDDNAKRSTAYNVDYTYQVWRDCFEGKLTWLNTFERGAEYRSGDAMGCMGVWFSGRWRTEPAVQFIAQVEDHLRNRIWTQASFGPATPVAPGSTTTTVAPTTTTTVAPTTTGPAATTTTVAPTTTRPATTTTTTTTVAPTTTRPATTTTAATLPPTTVPPTTTTPPGAAFAETFTANTGLNRFRTGTHHRGVDAQGGALTSATWQADHDKHLTDCGDPNLFHHTADKADRTSSFYVCRDHMMTTMGDVDGYSVTWFTPAQVFNGRTKVAWDVTVTDLGDRQWWEVAIIPAGGPEATVIDWLSPDPSNLPNYPASSVVIGSGPFGGDFHVHSAGQDRTPTWQPMCGAYALDPEGCASKALRRPWSVTDNRNGTITIRFNAFTWTVNGSFPSGDFEVIFKQHSYTPDKDGIPMGHTFHWDNIIIS